MIPSIRQVFFVTTMLATPIAVANSEPHYEIEIIGKNTSFNTKTGLSSIKGYSKCGLVSMTKRAESVLVRYWEPGAFRETVTFNGKILVDGYDTHDMARISSFRLAPDGSYAYLRSEKGPKSRVRLLQDGSEILNWPRGQLVRILSFDGKELVTAEFNQQSLATEMFSYARSSSGRISPNARKLGLFENCTLLSARPYRDGFALQAYCNHENGSDILFLDRKSGTVSTLLDSSADEILWSSLPGSKGKLSILKVSGNENGRRAFHALTGIFLSSLGEPMSLASDEAGRQSWGQSYRLRAFGIMAQKTGHPVFSALALYSMDQTLRQQNSAIGLQNAHNPQCGWRSRIYSSDGRAPISLLVNQAMISSSMLQTCKKLGSECPLKLKRRILDNARCLISAYEPNFDNASGLYRISFGAPFRFDGIWAPWNWQMAWVPVLRAVGKEDSRPELTERASNITNAFLKSWTIGDSGALWRYWSPHFYAGWKPEDQISKSRPLQMEHSPRRYEDISHAGISLLGLTSIDASLTDHTQKAIQITLNAILSNGIAIPRDLDGSGPQSSRWLPGAGFDVFATPRMKQIYSRYLPGARSGDQLLAYANLIEPDKPIRIDLEHFACSLNKCITTQRWHFKALKAFLESNPFVEITPAE